MRNRGRWFLETLALLGCSVAIATGCAGNSNPPPKPAETVEAQPEGSEPAATEEPAEPTANAQVANPASANCVKNGGKLEIMDGEGGQFGVCIFEDGSRCEEWSFMRKQCAAGDCRETTGICKEEKK